MEFEVICSWKKDWYFWQLYIVDIHPWPCIYVHVLLNNISAWCCSMLTWCGEREMNIGWDQIWGMCGIYHLIFLHVFLLDTAIHAISNTLERPTFVKRSDVIFFNCNSKLKNSKNISVNYWYSHQNLGVTFETKNE